MIIMIVLMTMLMVKVETCWICKHKITEDHISANKKFYHPGCMKVNTLQCVTSHVPSNDQNA